ncbi:MAG: hypothetical protein KatS3mg111_1496 [Pirellulaceae bacterium]|nr:MAG: hypothetical protein KatS3mg111_1496 [Pirellulaceae bacterium]
MRENRLTARVIVRCAMLLCCVCSVLAQRPVHGQEKTPPAEEKKITFDEHIKPIFREHCTVCHSESDKESDLALDTYAGALAGGSSGQVLAEGDPDGSRLFKLITHAERPFMPPDEDAISKEKIALVRTWIEQGMPENAGSKIKRRNAAAASMLGGVTMGRPEGPPPMPKQLLREPVLETPRSAAIAALAISPWAPLVAVGGQQQVLLYHGDSGELLGVLPFPEGEPQCLRFTRDGKQLLIGGGRHGHSGCAVLVDIESGKRIAKVGDELDTVLAADITPDKQRIALAGPQRIVRVFNTLTGELELELKKHTDWVYTLRYSPDGILLASGDRSNGLLVWEADTGTLYADLRGHQGEIRSLDFRPDSNVLASSSLDGTVRLWDMFESKQIKSWNAHGGGVHAIAYATNGTIATAGGDAKVKLWDGNGNLQKEFTGLTETVLEVALGNEGKLIAGGDWNGNVRVWPTDDPQTPHPVAANPPSIETRLQQAQSQLAQIEAQLKTAAERATQAEQAAQQQMAAIQKKEADIAALVKQQEQAVAERSALKSKVESLDTEIKELEARLAAAKQARAAAAEQLTKVEQQTQQLEQQRAMLDQQLAADRAQHEKLAQAAAAAAKERDALQSQYEAAKQELDKAQADKAALDAYAEQLRNTAAAAAARLAELSKQHQTVQQETAAQQETVAQLDQQLTELQAQLAELQKRLEQLTMEQQRAREALQMKTSAVEKLQAELAGAEEAAATAAQELQLFEAAYQRPQ